MLYVVFVLVCMSRLFWGQGGVWFFFPCFFSFFFLYSLDTGWIYYYAELLRLGREYEG